MEVQPVMWPPLTMEEYSRLEIKAKTYDEFISFMDDVVKVNPNVGYLESRRLFLDFQEKKDEL